MISKCKVCGQPLFSWGGYPQGVFLRKRVEVEKICLECFLWYRKEFVRLYKSPHAR